MKRRVIALTLAAVMAVSLTACGNGAKGEGGSGGSVKLNVTTTFAGEDGNAQNFKEAVAAWEKETGNTVEDASATSDETFKTRVITDFETGSERMYCSSSTGLTPTTLLRRARWSPSTRSGESIPSMRRI